MIQKYDKNGMCKIYDQWPSLARYFYNKNYEKIDFSNIDHIVFAGMGGSGAVGETLAAILSKTSIHLSVVKGFHLPETADSSTLVIATSASGNTLETLTVLNKAKQSGCKIIAFSSGGKVKEICQKKKIEFRNIPLFNSPRASFPIYLYSILNVLESSIPVRRNDVYESIKKLEGLQRQIRSSNLHNNPSLEIAQWLHNIPIIYYPAGLQAAAIRFKNSLQENAKIHAIAEDVIETCHNGIMSWETSSHIQPILIIGKDDYVKTKKLWKIIMKYFEKNKIDYREIHSVNGSILSKIMNLTYLLDYATIYNAIIKKIDPTPVESINFIKGKMK